MSNIYEAAIKQALSDFKKTNAPVMITFNKPKVRRHYDVRILPHPKNQVSDELMARLPLLELPFADDVRPSHFFDMNNPEHDRSIATLIQAINRTIHLPSPWRKYAFPGQTLMSNGTIALQIVEIIE